MLRYVSPVLAPSGGLAMSFIPPLLEDKQTSGERTKNDANDPTRTSAANLAVMHNVKPVW